MSARVPGAGIAPHDKSAADRLMAQVRNQRLMEGVEHPTPEQVAIVLHALADHTAIMQALCWTSIAWTQGEAATNVGRWFHAVADDLEGGAA